MVRACPCGCASQGNAVLAEHLKVWVHAHSEAKPDTQLLSFKACVLKVICVVDIVKEYVKTCNRGGPTDLSREGRRPAKSREEQVAGEGPATP